MLTCRFYVYSPAVSAYYMLFNILDYPAGVIPFTSVTKNDVIQMENYPEHDAAHKQIKKVSLLKPYYIMSSSPYFILIGKCVLC